MAMQGSLARKALKCTMIVINRQSVGYSLWGNCPEGRNFEVRILRALLIGQSRRVRPFAVVLATNPLLAPINLRKVALCAASGEWC